MAATFAFKEDNGAATGSPSRGTTAGTTVTTCNWKNKDVAADTSTDAYSANPITAGTHSYHKYQYGNFTGTFNQILNGKWSPHTAGTLAANCTLVGKVTSTYATPAVTALGSATDYSAIVAIGSGAGVNFSTTGPYDGSPTATLSAAGYSQYLVTQLQTASNAAAGDIASITLTLQYDEN